MSRGYGGGSSGYGYRDSLVRETGPYERDLDQRNREANRRMEDASFRCVRTLHETMQIANETSEELERQVESLDRTEDNLDKIAVNLESSSKRNMREVKSVFGSMINRFPKPKFDKDPAPSRSYHSSPPAQTKKGQVQQQQVRKPKSTGNEVVDRNLDELEAGLTMLEGQAYLMGSQIDEYNDKFDRVRTKMKFIPTKNNILNQKQREELFGGGRTNDSYKTPAQLYLKEHEHIRGSDALAEEAISIAMTTNQNLSCERNAFSSITSGMQSVTLDGFPLINSCVQKINLRNLGKRRVIGAVIAVCLIILLFLLLIY